MSSSPILSPEALDAFLAGDPASYVRRERSREKYDLLSFGGGSCPKVVGRHSARFGWKKLCFLTNGSDNGGSTQKIVEALRPEYGSTLPVGDITSALIGLLDPFRYELLNLRGWKLDPERFTTDERQAYTSALENRSSFFDRLSFTIERYIDKFASGGAHPPRPSAFAAQAPPEAPPRREASADKSGTPPRRRPTPPPAPLRRRGPSQESPSWEGLGVGSPAQEQFCAELLELGRLVDKVGLIRSGIKGLDITEASVRHHIFNALMIRTGAYDSSRKVPDPGCFMVGLSLLQRALSIDHAVFPCSLDEQVLYAEWIDKSGKVIWSTKHTSAERPVTGIGGQVALSNAPDSARILENGEYARYGRFGFDPQLAAPRAYPEALEAIRRVRPGAPILFGPSSFVASISPCLAVREVADEIANRSDCPRILFLNLTLNNETVGWNVEDFLNFWELNTGKPVSDTIDYVVVNNDLKSTPEVAEALKDKGDTLETFKFRGPVKLTKKERAAIPGRGINLVEAPLAGVIRTLMRLSSTGEREFVWVPSHNSERLMTLCHLLVEDFSAKPAGPQDEKRLTLDTEGKTEAIMYGHL